MSFIFCKHLLRISIFFILFSSQSHAEGWATSTIWSTNEAQLFGELEKPRMTGRYTDKGIFNFEGEIYFTCNSDNNVIFGWNFHPLTLSPDSVLGGMPARLLVRFSNRIVYPLDTDTVELDFTYLNEAPLVQQNLSNFGIHADVDDGLLEIISLNEVSDAFASWQQGKGSLLSDRIFDESIVFGITNSSGEALQRKFFPSPRTEPRMLSWVIKSCSDLAIINN